MGICVVYGGLGFIGVMNESKPIGPYGTTWHRHNERTCYPGSQIFHSTYWIYHPSLESVNCEVLGLDAGEQCNSGLTSSR